MTARKIQVSITLSADVLRIIDEHVEVLTRSAVIESWIKQSAPFLAAKQLERDIIDCYERQCIKDKLNDEELAKLHSDQLSLFERLSR